MASKQQLTVTTQFGTFTRSTARKYQFLVISCGEGEAGIRTYYAKQLADAKKGAARYAKAAEFATANPGRPFEGFTFPAADWQQWANNCEQAAAENEGKMFAALAANAARITGQKYIVQGWSGSLQLARMVANKALKNNYLNVRIIEVATGQEAI